MYSSRLQTFQIPVSILSASNFQLPFHELTTCTGETTHHARTKTMRWHFKSALHWQLLRLIIQTSNFQFTHNFASVNCCKLRNFACSTVTYRHSLVNASISLYKCLYIVMYALKFEEKNTNNN